MTKLNKFIEYYKNNPIGAFALFAAAGLLIAAHIVGSHWLFDLILGSSLVVNLIGSWIQAQKQE